jgi:hypothetical protein
MNRVTIDGDPAYRSSESDSHHVYIISFSERPIGASLGELKRYITDLVRVVSGTKDQLVNDYQDIQWPGQPYIQKMEQLSPVQWVVIIVQHWID